MKRDVIIVMKTGSTYFANHPDGNELARALTPIESADRAFDNPLSVGINTAEFIDGAGRVLGVFRRGGDWI